MSVEGPHTPEEPRHFDEDTATVEDCDRELERLRNIVTMSEIASDGGYAEEIRGLIEKIEEIRKKRRSELKEAA